MRIKREMLLKRKRRRKPSILPKLLIILSLVIIFFLIGGSITLAWFLKDLPSPSKLSVQPIANTVVMDRKGKVLYEFYKEKKQIPVKLKDVSKYVIWGTIAIEDKNFYKHKGISERGIIRALFNIIFRKKLQGGSTITQQLIKNILLTPERTISRKIKEVILAFEVERRYTKDEILEMYLNNAPYGGPYWGIETAAQGYFGKSAKELDLAESAVLAGLPQRPSFYSPYIGKNKAWVNRAYHVLRRMREDGYITKQEEEQARKKIKNLTFKKPKFTIKAPHFVFFVKEQLEKKYGPDFLQQGLKIKTTLDLKLQNYAEKIAKEEIEKMKKYKVTNTAIVALDSKTSEILAMVGSYDFFDEKYGNFNAAVSLRQPGSAIKPITYALAIERGYSPSFVLMDIPTEFYISKTNIYRPQNYGNKYNGPVQLRFALGNSLNIPAVKLLALVGVEDFLEKAYKMGITTFEPTPQNLRRFGLSITLGGGEVKLLELTNAYTIFARGGEKLPYSYILEIKDFKGKTIYKKSDPKKVKIFDKAVAFLISHILSDNNARLAVFGPNSLLKIPGKTVAVKTGTTNDLRDNWAIGFTKDITIGVWVGNNDNSPMKRVSSGFSGATPIWHKIMRYALSNGWKDGIIEKPNNVKQLQIDAFLGGLPKEGYPTREEYFIEGTEPKDISPFYKKLKISKKTGKLANEYEIKTGEYEEKEFIVITENDPLSTDGRNRWQEAIDRWIEKLNDPRFKPPKEISDYKPEKTEIIIKSPKENEEIKNNEVEIKGEVITTNTIEKITITINEIVIFEGENTTEFNEILSLGEGNYTLQVKVKEKDKDEEIIKEIQFKVVP